MKNTSKFNLRLSAISIGVIALFSVSSAMADDEEIKALTQPKSSVQVEAISVDQNSAKFGEYNGLYGNKSGAYPNGALNVRGGGAYTNNEQGDTTRWSVTGDNLGLTSRSANASISDQGSWGVGVNFDQLQHNISNSFQTPYQGSMGGNSFTLPTNLLNQNINTRTIMQSDLSTMNISSTRYNTTFNGSAIVDKNLNFTFEYNNLTQTGAKLQATMGATAPGTNGGMNNAANSSAIAILPVPTNYQTDTLTLAANWKGDNSHLTASYFGSFFKNTNSNFQFQAFETTTAQTASTPANPMQTYSVAPSNAFNQLNLAGGYDFTQKTKLTSNLSAGQNTQNQGFAGTYDVGMMYGGAIPAASMNGIVNTTHADVKVTDQSVKDLTLTALAKFDERDNLSQSNLYNSYSPSTKYSTTPNTPMSIKQTQISFGGDYRITKDQKFNLTLANNNVNRWCNQYGTTAPSSLVTPVNSSALFYNSSSCVSATSSNENKADALYKLKVSDDVNLKVGAGYSNRKTAWDQNAYIALPGTSTSIGAGGGWVNSGNVPGYYPFFEASRKQYIGKASADWQATDQLSFTLGGKYTSDLYPDSTYGVTNGYAWSLNFDSTFAYSEDGTLSAYATQQNMQRNLSSTNSTSNTTAPTSANYPWANSLQTNTTTLGLGAKHKGLVDGKVSLSADLTYSIANSTYNTTSNSTGCAATAPVTSSCGMLPGIQNNMAAIKFGGTYQVDKSSKIGLMYWYQHLYSNDYYYNGYQSGYVPTGVMPTNQSNPSYSVNVLMANYTYTFD